LVRWRTDRTPLQTQYCSLCSAAIHDLLKYHDIADLSEYKQWGVFIKAPYGAGNMLREAVGQGSKSDISASVESRPIVQ
jgi:hypothetical protein